MNEQKTPKYSLDSIKNAFNKEEKLVMTYSAKRSQISLGFSDQEVVNAIQALTTFDFYKSMAPIKPGFVAWHDVYKSTYCGIELYIKFQVGVGGELILSFKEK